MAIRLVKTRLTTYPIQDGKPSAELLRAALPFDPAESTAGSVVSNYSLLPGFLSISSSFR